MSYGWFLKACLKAISYFRRTEVHYVPKHSGEKIDLGGNELKDVSRELRRFNEIARAFANQHEAHYVSKRTDNEDALRVAKWSVTWSAIASVFAFLAALGTIASAFYAQRQLSQARTDTEFQRQLNKVVFFVNFTTSNVVPGTSLCDPVTRICDKIPPSFGDAFNLGDLSAPIIANYTHFQIAASIRNFGHVIESIDYTDFRFYIAKELPSVPSYSGYLPAAPIDPDLKPGPYRIVNVDYEASDAGQFVKFREDLTIKEFSSARDFGFDSKLPIFARLMMGNDLNLFIYGRVGYTDQFNLRREFGFAQKLSHVMQVWSRTGSDSYNYDRVLR